MGRPVSTCPGHLPLGPDRLAVDNRADHLGLARRGRTRRSVPSSSGPGRVPGSPDPDEPASRSRSPHRNTQRARRDHERSSLRRAARPSVVHRSASSSSRLHNWLQYTGMNVQCALSIRLGQEGPRLRRHRPPGASPAATATGSSPPPNDCSCETATAQRRSRPSPPRRASRRTPSTRGSAARPDWFERSVPRR